MWRDIHGARSHMVNSPNMAFAAYATGLLGGKNYDLMARTRHPSHARNASTVRSNSARRSIMTQWPQS